MKENTIRIMVLAMACALALCLVGCSGGSSSGSAPSSTGATASASVQEDPFAQPIENETDAINRIHDSLMRAGKEIPPKIEFVKMIDGDRYLIHGYEVVKDGGGYTHDSTWFHYSIGKDGSIRDETLLVDLDPETLEPM